MHVSVPAAEGCRHPLAPLAHSIAQILMTRTRVGISSSQRSINQHMKISSVAIISTTAKPMQ